MNRRSFLSGLSSLVGGVLLEKAIPLGRVWSFPKEVKCLNVSKEDLLCGHRAYLISDISSPEKIQVFKCVDMTGCPYVSYRFVFNASPIPPTVFAEVGHMENLANRISGHIEV